MQYIKPPKTAPCTYQGGLYAAALSLSPLPASCTQAASSGGRGHFLKCIIWTTFTFGVCSLTLLFTTRKDQFSGERARVMILTSTPFGGSQTRSLQVDARVEEGILTKWRRLLAFKTKRTSKVRLCCRISSRLGFMSGHQDVELCEICIAALFISHNLFMALRSSFIPGAENKINGMWLNEEDEWSLGEGGGSRRIFEIW